MLTQSFFISPYSFLNNIFSPVLPLLYCGINSQDCLLLGIGVFLFLPHGGKLKRKLHASSETLLQTAAHLFSLQLDLSYACIGRSKISRYSMGLSHVKSLEPFALMEESNSIVWLTPVQRGGCLYSKTQRFSWEFSHHSLQSWQRSRTSEEEALMEPVPQEKGWAVESRAGLS